MDRTGARQALRHATADLHERVDRAFADADLTTSQGYGRFLSAQAAAYLPVERALEAAGAERLIADWAGRRRGPLLLDDLAALGLEPPQSPAFALEGTPAAVLGAAYVLEGSRLGGVLLARKVYPGAPTRFLTRGDPAAWRRLLAAIEAGLRGEEEITAAAAAARAVFIAFETGARAHLDADV